MCVGLGVCTNQQTLLRKFDHRKKREIEIEIVFKGIWPDQQSALGDKGGGKGGVCGGERQWTAPHHHHHPLPSSELFSESLPGNFNGCGIWTGKKRRWKFQRKRRFEPHHASASVCVLPGRAREGGGRERESAGGRASEAAVTAPHVCATRRRTILERSARHTDDLHYTHTHTPDHL